MFTNVPRWLQEKVEDLKTQTGVDHDTIYYAASGWTIACYLGKDINQAAALDGFFGFSGKPPAEMSHEEYHDHKARSILLAEMLFLLRSSPGFEEQRKRLASRSLRPAYFEMLAAKQFFKAGFNIQARRETGTKGEDFDFSAIKGAETINVEVTALTATSFSENTILNALNQKRAQLPTDAPAVIYCMMPEFWFPTPDNWNNDVPPVINKFLRGTRRINVVVAWTERRVSVTHNGEPGRALMVIRNAFANPEPKVRTKSLDFLFGGKSSQQANLELASDNGLDKLMKESNANEFFWWVDHLIAA